MPGLNGLELCEKLHEANPNIQIILISGYADFSYAQRAIQLGVLGYCLKPVDIQYLQKLLRQAVQNIRREVSLQADTLWIIWRKVRKDLCAGFSGNSASPRPNFTWPFPSVCQTAGRHWKPGSPSVWESVNTCICVKNPSPGMQPAVLSGKAGKKAASVFLPLPYPLAS